MAESEYIMSRLNINFLNEEATEEMKDDFFTAIQHEETLMLICSVKDSIEKLEKQLKKDDITKEEAQAIKTKLELEKATLETLKRMSDSTSEIFNKVLEAMCKKNENHFGNRKEVVRNVLRILSTVENSKLIKYALVETFEGAELRDALDTIHVNSKTNEDGCITQTKEVKEAYKKASNELESIIKNTFSLPFETPYTAKTRIKLNAGDKKLLHDCYVKGFRNKFSENEKTGLIDFTGRQVNTLVKVRKDKKTGQLIYNYSGLHQTICQIVQKHYFK